MNPRNQSAIGIVMWGGGLLVVIVLIGLALWAFQAGFGSGAGVLGFVGLVATAFFARQVRYGIQFARIMADFDGVNAVDQLGRRPLHVAVEKGATDTVNVLLANGADINARDQEGYTPLYRSLIHRRDGIAKRLIRAGAGIDSMVMQAIIDSNAEDLLREIKYSSQSPSTDGRRYPPRGL